jgi:uncharacterized glyoxalase superfamily protein PhnB
VIAVRFCDNGAVSQTQLLKSACVFLVTDVVAAAEHYRDCLGFSYDRFWGDPPAFCMVWRDNHCVMLSRVADPTAVRPIAQANPSVWDAYFWVRDVDTLFEELKTRGARISYQPVLKDYGVREFAVWDLNGYQLAFGQDDE